MNILGSMDSFVDSFFNLFFVTGRLFQGKNGFRSIALTIDDIYKHVQYRGICSGCIPRVRTTMFLGPDHRMKLTTVLSAVNDNPAYYKFIPKQILFWNKFAIRFVVVFIGATIPEELAPYRDNIIQWNKNLDVKTAFVGQNMRLYYPALLTLPDDELVMITDMDMLPTKDTYFKSGLESYTKRDFIYYRHIERDQFYIMYNAAHPSTWATVFGIRSEADIEQRIYDTYKAQYDGIPGSTAWYTDQETLYKHLIQYPHLKVLNRPIKRLEVSVYRQRRKTESHFLHEYDDCHFHRDFVSNHALIQDAERQLMKKITPRIPLWMKLMRK